MGEKRTSFQQDLQLLDELDKTITAHLTSYLSLKLSSYGKWRSFMIKSEFACHGLIWLSLCCVLLRFSESKTVQQLLVNLFTALVLDIVLVAVIKAVVRRPRPPHTYDKMRFTFPTYKYTFPSGHTTRAVVLATIFYQKRIGGFFGSYLSIALAFLICISRILLGRNHVGDVLAGILLGLLEAGFFLFFWFSADTAQKILRTLSMFHIFFGDGVNV